MKTLELYMKTGSCPIPLLSVSTPINYLTESVSSSANVDIYIFLRVLGRKIK